MFSRPTNLGDSKDSKANDCKAVADHGDGGAGMLGGAEKMVHG